MTKLYIILPVLGFLVGGIVISLGGGGAAFFLSILTGVGHLSASSAAATSLFVGLPALMVGSYSHWRTGNMCFHEGNQMLIAALPSTIIGSLVAKYIPETIYSWIIFIIFILLGVQMLLQSFHRNTPVKNKTHRSGMTYVFGILSGLMVGIAGLSGGGPLVAGLLLIGLTMQQAAATSSYVLVITSIVGLFLHATQGHTAWVMGAVLMIGALLGSAIAPRFLSRLNPQKVTLVLRPIMGLFLILMGLKLVIHL